MYKSIDDILGNKYKEQINDDTNDTVIYEVRRFLELVGTNNPTVLELLNTPEDCVIYKDPIFDIILENKEKLTSNDGLISRKGINQVKPKKVKPKVKVVDKNDLVERAGKLTTDDGRELLI